MCDIHTYDKKLFLIRITIIALKKCYLPVFLAGLPLNAKKVDGAPYEEHSGISAKREKRD